VLHGGGDAPALGPTLRRAQGQRICHRRLPARRLAERVMCPPPKVVGRDTPKDTPARSNTLSTRRYPGQATRIYLEGRAYLAGRRG
jgi:hypothetical protein